MNEKVVMVPMTADFAHENDEGNLICENFESHFALAVLVKFCQWKIIGDEEVDLFSKPMNRL